MANADGGVFNMSRQQANAQRQQVNLPALQLNEVAQHLNRVRTLQRNFHECVKGAQLNRYANRRDRFDEPGLDFILLVSNIINDHFQKHQPLQSLL